jgi:negative regulator of flagellin synthesis FlgM
MKISNSNLANQAYNSNIVHQNQTAINAKTEKIKEPNLSSNVDLSNRTKDVQKIAQAIEDAPVSMSEKLASLKKQVNTNQYNIDADKIADKMVGSILDEII